jgi:hypothetical protein
MTDIADMLTNVCRRGHSMARAVFVGCGVALTLLSACQASRAEECFDFDTFSYVDESAAKSAFDACYPTGTDLEGALNSDSGQYSIDFAAALPSILGANLGSIGGGPNENLVQMHWRKPLNDTLVNHWIIAVHLDSRNQLLDSEIMLIFQDSDHRARGLPLSFSVLPWGRVRTAVEQHLPPDPEIDSVARLLENAGAVLVDTREMADGSKRTVHCFKLRQPHNFFQVGKLISKFDTQGGLIDYEVLLEPSTLKYRECDRLSLG